MKAGKPELEFLAIRTLCAGKDAGLSLLNNLTPAHFNFPTPQLMYRRLMARLKSEGSVPDWNDLLNDSTIPEEKRQNAQRIVNKKRLKPLVTKRRGESLFDNLDRYRKLRAFFEVLKKSGNAISQSNFDIDEIIKNAKSEIIAIDVNHRGSPITVDGIKDSHVVEALTNADSLIPTGFTEFDEQSGGIPESAVFLMGADTGGFKSVTSLQMAMNIAMPKKNVIDGMPTGQRRVGFYSLEMTLPQVTRRKAANVTSTNIGAELMLFQEMRRKAKSAAELEKINKEVAKRAQKVAEIYKQNSESWSEFLHFTCPADEVDINWILQQAEMSDREVIIIDYVGLLSGLSGDDQWRAMSNVVRQAKIWTNRTSRTVIILAQMRFENGKPELKYSKAILDHCVSGDTLIDTGNGIVTIASLSGEKGPRQAISVPVITDGNKKSFTSAFHHNGRKAVVDMFLSDGRRLRVTPNHKIRVLQSDLSLGWKKVEELTQEDFVVLSGNKHFASSQVSLNFPQYQLSHHNEKGVIYPSKVDHRLAYLIGMLLSDGHLGSNVVSWVTKDYDVAVKLQRYCNTLFGKDSFRTHESKTRIGTKIWRVRSGRKAAVQLFNNFIGLQGGSANKFIPNEIMRSPRTVVIECIKGMMDGDGCNDGNIIHYTSTSRHMLERLQILLDKLGVRSFIRNRPIFINATQAYQLQIMGEESLKYLSTVGFTTERKNSRKLKANVGKYTGKFPLLNDYLKNERFDSKMRGVTSLRSKIKECVGVRRDRNINKDDVTKVGVQRIQTLDYELGRKLSTILNGDYHFASFVRVENAGVEDVYDLTVPETHNYVANGIKISNCNNAWAWQHLHVNGRDYLVVTQMKAREQKKFFFGLRVYPEFSKVTDLMDAADDEIIRNAIDDIKKGKDPEKRYQKNVDGNAEAGRRDIDVDDDEPLLVNGGFAGGKSKVKSYDVSAEDSEEFTNGSVGGRFGSRSSFSTFAERITAKAIREKAKAKTRVVALQKLNNKVAGLTVEEAAIQAEDVIRRWEEASAGKRINIDQLASELLGLTARQDLVKRVKSIENDAAAKRRLSKDELAIHKQQIEVIREATKAIKTKGEEFVSAEDFYAKDDLVLSVERGEEPIADPRTLDQPWETNAMAWADQPAITLPNSAKPSNRRWGNDENNDTLRQYNTNKKQWENSRRITKGTTIRFWPPQRAKLDDFHYLDDLQLDSVITIANKYLGKSLEDVSLDSLVTDLSQYVELMGPGYERLKNKRSKTIALTDDTYKEACKRFGLRP